MPIKHSAFLQLKKDEKRHARNHSVRAELRTLTKQLTALIREQKTEDAGEMLKRVAKKYDQAASRKIIHKKTANRFKSRLSVSVNRIGS